MNRVTLQSNDNAAEGVLYMAMELGDKRWKLVFILMYVQVETNYPRPCRYAAHSVMIVRQMWQPHMQLCDHGIEVVEHPIRELLFSQFIP